VYSDAHNLPIAWPDTWFEVGDICISLGELYGGDHCSGGYAETKPAMEISRPRKGSAETVFRIRPPLDRI
jgi:hypothetical protein